jgi:hypothetical protein
MIKGFDEFSNKLKNLQNNANKISGNNKVPFNELFPESFMKMHTLFSSIQEMFDNSPFEINSSDDFLEIEKEELDKFVDSKTNLSSWDEMMETAVTEWTFKKLGL